MTCALLDALALRLDLAAAAGRHPLMRTPAAIMARILSKVIAFWSTSWVGTTFGLAWIIRTYRHSQEPPLHQLNKFVAQRQAELESPKRKPRKRHTAAPR